MGKRVTVIEDSKNIAISIKICLETCGYQVTTVEDGVTALEELFKDPPDLVLLDILLPKMSGLLVLEAIRDNPGTRHLPVIIISAKSQENDIQAAYDAGADDYLVKPFTPTILLSHIEIVLKER